MVGGSTPTPIPVAGKAHIAAMVVCSTPTPIPGVGTVDTAATVVGSMPVPIPVDGTVDMQAMVAGVAVAAPLTPAFSPWPSRSPVAPLVAKVAI